MARACALRRTSGRSIVDDYCAYKRNSEKLLGITQLGEATRTQHGESNTRVRREGNAPQVHGETVEREWSGYSERDNHPVQVGSSQ